MDCNFLSSLNRTVAISLLACYYSDPSALGLLVVYKYYFLLTVDSPYAVINANQIRPFLLPIFRLIF